MFKSVIAVLSGVLLLASSAVLAETLIKESEASLPPPPQAKGATRAITRGPGISIVSPNPSGQKITSPFPLNIVFEPHGGAKIDLSSVRISYLRSENVDLLDRVHQGLTEKGINLASAEVPPGEHQIRVVVQDSEGRQSTTVLNLNVIK